MMDRDSDIMTKRGMDKKIESKTWTTKRIAMAGGALAVAGLFIYAFVFKDWSSTLNVDKQKLTISTVKKGSFQEFISITGTVQPIQTVYLDAREGGVVQKISQQSGAKVQKGDTILALSNSSLRLNVLQQKTSIYNQINQTRNSRLNIKQNSRSLETQLASAQKNLRLARSAYQRKSKLYQKNLIAKKTYENAKENYRYQKKNFNLIYKSYKQDSLRAKTQLQQIDESLDRMQRSLTGVQHILDKLVIEAPISGQLSTIQLNPGQSISSGQRVGQIDRLNNFKVRADIDEYNLSRVRTGLHGSFTYDGKKHTLKITKVYPVVKNGKFKVDMKFEGEAPSQLTRGQSLQIRLALSQNKTRALLLPRGGFYQQTGGNWVYKVTDNGQKAVRQPIKLGRQNPDYFEVLSGLQPGDKVITSSYDTFGDNKVLDLK
ncbi:MAG TPA: efflux RND transporter periplasmic adaptor subunit [Balneolaceae bacterium]|nr:efflux RND transporter periplasmic adaptor subunit [Balneolaceae bacterium]